MHIKTGEHDDKLSGISKTHNQSVDQLLQIVNGGISREYAVSLLEKMKGDVTAAVDIFYSTSENNNVVDVDMNVVQNEMIDKSSSTDMACDTSQAIPKMSNLHVQTSLCSSACSTGQLAPYLNLAHSFDLVEREKGKIKRTAILCNMLKRFLNIYLFR
jgi:DNA ligase 1